MNDSNYSYKFCKDCSGYIESSEFEEHFESHFIKNENQNQNNLEASICFAGPNVSKNMLKKIDVCKILKNDPKYLHIKKGINLLSKCSNVDCCSKRRNYRIYNQLGLNKITFPDIYDGNLKCLECENVLEIDNFITIALCDCRYKWSGKERVKENNKNITIIHNYGEWLTVNGVRKFKENENELNWYCLEFIADKLPALSESIILKSCK